MSQQEICQSCGKPGDLQNPLIFVQERGSYHRSCARAEGFIQPSRQEADVEEEPAPYQPPAGSRPTQQYEYKVVEVRERMFGGRMSGEGLERLLNQHAAQGWRLKSMTSADVKGRIGFGGVEGILITFERQRTSYAPARTGWGR